MNDIPEDVMKRAEKLLRNIEHEAEADHDYYLVWVRPMAVDAIARALMEERAAATSRWRERLTSVSEADLPSDYLALADESVPEFPLGD